MNSINTVDTTDTTDTTEDILTTPVIPQQKVYSADLLKAHVALMEKEVILPKQVELFRLVNRHYRALQTWHDQNTGWRIQRGPTAIRLIRHLSAITPGYLYERLKEPNDFACLTWILWYAENRQLTGRGNDQQFLLSQLAESISEQSTSAATGEAQFDFRRQNDRYSIQRALQTLENLGGLQLVDGQTREWVEQTPDADVLYEFTDVVHALVAALNPQLVAMVATRLKDGATTLQPTRLVGMAETPSDLVRAWRVLLLGPALFRYDDPAAFAALIAHADDVANELIETFGWLLDIHRDYACIVRASGMSTGPVTSLTPYGTNDQIAMLLCRAIRGQVEAGTWSAPDAYGCLHVTSEDMTALFYSVRERYGEQWGSEARGKSSRSLLNDVYRKMRQIGLLRGPNEAGNMLVLPTAARYTATYDKAEQEIAPNKGQANKAKSANAPVKIALPGISATVKAPVKSTAKKR
ncbi:MAG TPA: TIGR02678 family protein [Ktedonobacteraceae bacterium]|nr:TIGR02678 family protein [Ktedonobacteraceae bacterium]